MGHMQNAWRYMLFLLVGIGIGLAAFIVTPHAIDQDGDAECLKKYPLTNNDIGCNEYEESLVSLKALDTAFEEVGQSYITSGKAKRISVWVRDLDSRLWAASNEFERYAPASLMKLPLMIAYYKLAEVQPEILNAKLVYKHSEVLNDSLQNFRPAQPLVEGQEYSVQELIEHMMAESDNNAAAMLLSRVDTSLINNTLVELGVRIPRDENVYDFVTAKSYANIFRILYNASYLNREYSEKALELMANSSFKGIAESLPKETSVSHKFGEREVVNTATGLVDSRELHDCGIIYKNGKPYSLCIMTEGKNFDDLLSIIKDISRLTYEKI